MTCYGCMGIGAGYRHTCPKTDKPTFRVWWGESGEDIEVAEENYGRRYGHDDIDDAVETHADHFHSHEEGYECGWPVTFYARELSTGKVFEFEVERDFDPTFAASKATEVDVDAKRAARWWDAFIRMWGPVGQCRNNAPASHTGHWREWHRGHGCDKDPERAGLVRYCVSCKAEIKGGVVARGGVYVAAQNVTGNTCLGCMVTLPTDGPA